MLARLLLVEPVLGVNALEQHLRITLVTVVLAGGRSGRLGLDHGGSELGKQVSFTIVPTLQKLGSETRVVLLDLGEAPTETDVDADAHDGYGSRGVRWTHGETASTLRSTKLA